MMPWPVDPPGGVNEVVRNLIEEFRLAGEFHPVLIESHWASARPVVESRPDYTYIRTRTSKGCWLFSFRCRLHCGACGGSQKSFG